MSLLLYRNFVDIVLFKYSLYKIKDLVSFVITKNRKKKSILHVFKELHDDTYLMYLVLWQNNAVKCIEQRQFELDHIAVLQFKMVAF